MNEELEAHFAFGENWRDFARHVSRTDVDDAWKNLLILLAGQDVRGKSVLDLGCGSGIHAVALALHGARVTAIDLDPESVAATTLLAERFGVSASLSVSVTSVFDMPVHMCDFDIVYSWGVLHHTGNMWQAIDLAASRVSNSPGSLFILAIYRSTHLDAFWRIEKRIYSKLPTHLQGVVQSIYRHLHDFRNKFKVKARHERSGVKKRERGMSEQHDLHDWLGGYPYEAAIPSEVRAHISTLGFTLESESLILNSESKVPGFFGSGCDQYTFIRTQTGC